MRGKGERGVQGRCWRHLGKSVEEGLWGRAWGTGVRVVLGVLGVRHLGGGAENRGAAG